MNDLRTLKVEMDEAEREAVAKRKELQRRIRDGESTGRLTVDYAIAAGLPCSEDLMAEITAFHDKLHTYAGQAAVVVLASRLHAAGVPRGVSEVRMGILPATPAFRFDETGSGWTVGTHYAAMSMTDRAGWIATDRLSYSVTSGVTYPRPERQLAIGIHLGDLAVANFFATCKEFGMDAYRTLGELLGLPVTAKVPRTQTMRFQAI